MTGNATAPGPTRCTGCVLEAYWPATISFEQEQLSSWTSVVVTETVLVLTITYMQGTAIDTVITTQETLNQTTTVIGSANQTITHSAPVFYFEPVFGTTLTLDAGPTYVMYTEIWGGLEHNATETDSPTTGVLTAYTAEPTCNADVEHINYFDIKPTRTEDWSSFIQTFTDNAPENDNSTPLPLPPSLVEFLKLDPDVQNIFSGSDIATCTLHPTDVYTPEFPTPTGPPMSMSYLPPPDLTSTMPVFFSSQVPPPPPGSTQPTSTFLSTTYESTSTHVTRQGCLRCDTPEQIPPLGVSTPNPPNPSPKPGGNPDSQKNDPPNIKTPDIPGIISSILNDPKFNQDPKPKPPNPGQTITIGSGVVEIRPAQPTQPNRPNQQNTPKPQNPGMVIGSETLTAGQTTTINGVVVVVPAEGGGSSLVVGGTTIAVNPAQTGPPVLTVGETMVTANPQGQFVVGTQTLKPGGPAITVDGSTLSLGPSGTIAVVNGQTQTLGNAPFVTGAPVLTVNGQTISATVVGGTTQFVLGPGQTLTAGGVLTVDGTTFSMPAGGSGSTVVVNGITSTLDAPGLPILTLNNQIVTASVQGGTTAFVLGPGQTLVPGGVITISGTTYSMPASASGSVVVINGVTTTLGQGPMTAAPALTIDGKTYSATVRDGTTEYVLGPGTTLKPGEAITVSGTTYSLDPKGTALVVNGKTSKVPKVPASNSATVTQSASNSRSTSGSSRASSGSSSSSGSESSTASERQPANFIASGIGIDETGGAMGKRGAGLDKWVDGVVVGVAGWLMLLL